jgi:hypothetical protein
MANYVVQQREGSVVASWASNVVGQWNVRGNGWQALVQWTNTNGPVAKPDTGLEFMVIQDGILVANFSTPVGTAIDIYPQGYGDAATFTTTLPVAPSGGGGAGPPGPPGPPGQPGTPGAPGAPGEDAYHEWLDAGNTGTMAQFLASLVGPPGPPSGGGLPRPANQAALQALINAVGQNGVLALQLDPTTPAITLTSTLTINVMDVGDAGLFFDFGRVLLESGITDGVTPLIKLVGTTKHMVFQNLLIFGGAFSTAGCGDGLQIISSGGPILLSQFQNISSSWCGGNGISVQGDVYENTFTGWDCKNNKQNGALFSTPNGGVISNLRLISPDLSRNNLCGAQTANGVQSIDLIGGSFINNLAGGWEGAIRSASFVNFENTGAFGFDFSATGLPFMATILACNLTSDGGGTGIAAGGLIKYSGTANLQQSFNYCTAEGGLATPPPVLFS